MTHVYLVHFFTGDYIEMYHPIHRVKFVSLSESEALALVDAENSRLKRRQDFERAQLAWFERVPIGVVLFD